MHYTLYIYHGPCYRVRLHKLCDRGLRQLRGIVSRMLSEGPKHLKVSKRSHIVYVMVTSLPDARDGLLTSLCQMGSLARSASRSVDRLTRSLSRSFSAEDGVITPVHTIHDLGSCPSGVRLLNYAEFEAYRRMASSADAELCMYDDPSLLWFGRG